MVKAWCYEKRPSKLLHTSMANLKNSDQAIFYTVQITLLSGGGVGGLRGVDERARSWGASAD